MADRRRAEVFSFEETRRSRGSDPGAALDAIQLLLQDLIDAVQASAQQPTAPGAQHTDDQPASVTAPLIPGGAGGPIGPDAAVLLKNSIKCKSKFAKASAFTVQFGVDAVGGNPQATVAWTLGGNSITRVIDVVPGCSISGFAEHVNVTVSDNTDLSVAPAAPNPYNVTITISPNVRPTSGMPPIYTALPASNGANPIASGGTATFVVPPGANGLNVNGVSTGAAAQIRVDVYSSGAIGSTATKIQSYEVDSFTPGFIPLIGGAAQVQLTNEGGANAIVTAIFSVDG